MIFFLTKIKLFILLKCRRRRRLLIIFMLINKCELDLYITPSYHPFLYASYYSWKFRDDSFFFYFFFCSSNFWFYIPRRCCFLQNIRCNAQFNLMNLNFIIRREKRGEWEQFWEFCSAEIQVNFMNNFTFFFYDAEALLFISCSKWILVVYLSRQNLWFFHIDWPRYVDEREQVIEKWKELCLQ